MIAYSGVILVGTFANRNASVSLVALIVNAMSVSVPLVLFLSSTSDKTNTRAGIIAAVIGGTLVSLFALAFGKAYEQNNVAIVSPIIFGGSIVVTSVLSYFIFKEKILPLQAAGLLFASVGLALIIYAKSKS